MRGSNACPLSSVKGMAAAVYRAPRWEFGDRTRAKLGSGQGITNEASYMGRTRTSHQLLQQFALPPQARPQSTRENSICQ